MSTTKTQRIVSLILALFFIASTVGLVGYYVIENKNQQKQQDTIAALNESIAEQNQSAQLKTEQKEEGKTLKGTTLQEFQPVAGLTSLQTTDLVDGTGDAVKASDSVTVHYTGALASNGTIFESSLDSGRTATFGLNQVIAGWTQGIPGMKVGGTRRLLIPASLAYGANPPSGSGIPANADLVFDVQLIKIN